MDLLDAALPEHARHPWERARFAFFSRLLSRRKVLSGAPRVLDVGAGDGWLARRLSDENPNVSFVCWDTNYVAPPSDGLRVRYVKEPPEGGFDVLMMLDVLEHVEDDRAFLRELVQDRLRPGGRLVFSVPAWNLLFSEHDRLLKHFRRYSPGGASRVLREAGLRIDEQGGLFHSLLVPRAIACGVEKMGRAGPAAAEVQAAWTHGGLVTRVVDAALSADGLVSEVAARAGMVVPGLSYFAVCTRAR